MSISVHRFRKFYRYYLANKEFFTKEEQKEVDDYKGLGRSEQQFSLSREVPAMVFDYENGKDILSIRKARKKYVIKNKELLLSVITNHERNTKTKMFVVNGRATSFECANNYVNNSFDGYYDKSLVEILSFVPYFEVMAEKPKFTDGDLAELKTVPGYIVNPVVEKPTCLILRTNEQFPDSPHKNYRVYKALLIESGQITQIEERRLVLLKTSDKEQNKKLRKLRSRNARRYQELNG